jgi:hypothetical protein
MTSRIRGRCLCGHVVYEYVGSIGAANYCHCEDCRRCTGSAFSIGVRLDCTAFHITSGDLNSFTKRGESGNELTRHFCPKCGSPIYTSSPKHPQHVYVKAGTLDDPTIVKPIRQNWVSSAVAWSRISGDIPSFEKGPE